MYNCHKIFKIITITCSKEFIYSAVPVQLFCDEILRPYRKILLTSEEIHQSGPVRYTVTKMPVTSQLQPLASSVNVATQVQFTEQMQPQTRPVNAAMQLPVTSQLQPLASPVYVETQMPVTG